MPFFYFFKDLMPDPSTRASPSLRMTLRKCPQYVTLSMVQFSPKKGSVSGDFAVSIIISIFEISSTTLTSLQISRSSFPGSIISSRIRFEFSLLMVDTAYNLPAFFTVHIYNFRFLVHVYFNINPLVFTSCFRPISIVPEVPG